MTKEQNFIRIKEIVQLNLALMDQVINSRLTNKESLVKEITNHLISSGGKRLRPTLLILIAQLFGYSKGTRHINLAAAVEFIHTATLLHDDVVDQSKLRRGKLTANNYWDNKSSVLVGDFLFSQSFLLMAEDEDPKVLKILSNAASIIAEGEVKQLSSITNLNLQQDSYLSVIKAKTAELFAAACEVGAVIANSSIGEQESMYQFGLNLGIAFQIIDDILDYKSKKEDMGKNVGDDFKEAKVTLPIILAYERSNQQEKIFWQKAFSNNICFEQDFPLALDLFSKYNILDECSLIAKSYTYKAEQMLDKAPNHEIKSLLIELLKFSVERVF